MSAPCVPPKSRKTKSTGLPETVNAYPGVTHNYLRENDFNVWFTFIAPSRDIIESNLFEIKEKTGVSEILNLPATRVFKIKAEFNLK